MKPLLFVIIFVALLIATYAEERYNRAVIESCPGCSLNRLSEVKRFIYDDVPKYNNIEFKKVHGAKPELVLYDENDSEVSRLKLEQLTRKQCNDLLMSKGFSLKENHKLEL